MIVVHSCLVVANMIQKQSTLLTAALMLLTSITLVACGKKVESTPIPAAVASAPVVVDQPTEDQALAAILRGHPNSHRACVDGLRENSFFLDYGPPLAPGAEEDGKYHGWLLLDRVEFYKTSNNTWFITIQKDEKYITVYPDVNGLNCKAH